MNKYIELALSMAKTRGDWSQGFYRVRDAMKNFQPVNDEEVKIAKTINEILEDEDTTDGRVFRDFEYNYDWIYKKKLNKDEQKEYLGMLREYWDNY